MTELVGCSIESETVVVNVLVSVVVLEQSMQVNLSVWSHISIGSDSADSVHGDAAAGSSASALKCILREVEVADATVVLVDIVCSSTKWCDDASCVERESVKMSIVPKQVGISVVER